MLAATPAARFTPTASLEGAPEDLLVQIFAFLPVIDVLAVRRCCRRLYYCTKARIVWLDALRKAYARRHLPPQLASPATTSWLSTDFIEHRATRSWRFLHALADIHSAKYRRTTHPIEDLIAHPPEEEGRGRSGVIGFHLLPEGRWLCMVYNRKAGQEPSKAVLIVWDIWRSRRLLSFPLHRSAHFAHFEYGEDGMSIEVVIGFDKTRQHDPFFNMMTISLAKPDGPLQITSMQNLKVERTPRACSVHDHVLASVDRLGHVTFWAWRESLFATAIVAGFPASKGKLMLLSRQYFATFNPASSAFAVHLVPFLNQQPPDAQLPAAGDSNRAGGMIRLLKQGEDAAQAAASLQPPPYYHLPPPTGMPSMGIRRFRLPARSLNFTTPERVSASSFYPSNAAFSEPFLGYVVLSHPETPSQPYIGIIPAIDSGELDDPEDMESQDEDDEEEEPEEDHGESDGVNSAPGTQQSQVASPHLPPAPVPPILALPLVSPVIAPPAQLAPPPAQPAADPEFKWLSTLRCVDSATTETFAPRGRILRVGPLDHYASILRATDDGKIEIFTTAALHAKPEAAQSSQANRSLLIPRASRQQEQQNQNQQRLPMPAFNLRNLVPAPTGDMTAGLRGVLFGNRSVAGPSQTSGAGPSQPRASSAPSASSVVDLNDVVAHVNLEAVLQEVDRAAQPTRPAVSRPPSGLLGLQPRLMPPTIPSAPLSGLPSPSSTRSNPIDATMQFANPHSRVGAYAEGDFQHLDYQAPGEVWASTVDDVSGKICLVVENSEERPEIVVLDYGWDFWKIENNEERQWANQNDNSADEWVARSQSV